MLNKITLSYRFEELFESDITIGSISKNIQQQDYLTAFYKAIALLFRFKESKLLTLLTLNEIVTKFKAEEVELIKWHPLIDSINKNGFNLSKVLLISSTPPPIESEYNWISTKSLAIEAELKGYDFFILVAKHVEINHLLTKISSSDTEGIISIENQFSSVVSTINGDNLEFLERKLNKDFETSQSQLIESCSGEIQRALKTLELIKTLYSYDYYEWKNSHSLKDITKVCLFLDTYYNEFLKEIYDSNPNLSSESFENQTQLLIDARFGDSDYYSYNLTKSNSLPSWKAKNLIINSAPLINSKANNYLEIVKDINPDVVYIQDLHSVNESSLSIIKAKGSLIVGQIASSFNSDYPLKYYDLIISSIPSCVEYFRSLGVPSIYQPLAYESRLTKGFNPFASRKIGLSFIGTLSGHQHNRRQIFLSTLAKLRDIAIYGTGIESYGLDSEVRNQYHGQALGIKMFKILENSKITFNIHSEFNLPSPDNKVATLEHANNMRLFEATGSGALLLTDYKSDLGKLFKIGDEIVAYNSLEECIELIDYYQSHPDLAEEIAYNGYLKTLRDHSYSNRLKTTAKWLGRLLKLKDFKPQIPENVSSNYKQVSLDSLNPSMDNGWNSNLIPNQQRALVDQELIRMYHQDTPLHFNSLAQLLKNKVRSKEKILEIGCSSGYYVEILEYLLNQNLNYTGIDLSESMIKLAKERYPDYEFDIGVGAALPYDAQQFDWVISGCVLLHDLNYIRQIRETARVAKKGIILHRTPVYKITNTSYFTKKAYGIDTIEIRFNESEILSEFKRLNFRESNRKTIEKEGEKETISYLFERI